MQYVAHARSPILRNGASRPHRRLKLQQVDFRAELSVHLLPLHYALALAPTANPLPHLKIFLQKRLSHKGYPPLWAEPFLERFLSGGHD
jgi:hypothetical protein